MLVVKSKNKISIRITDERWQHIMRRHPEMNNQVEKVLETIAEPELILKGDFESLLGVRFYPETPITTKFLIVVYKELADHGFIITAYFTRAYSKRREILWKC